MRAKYTIEDLCRAAGDQHTGEPLSRRTVRYYIERGILDPPEGKGRAGHYGDEHLNRLRDIRALQDQGYTFAAIAEKIRGKTALSVESPVPPAPLRGPDPFCPEEHRWRPFRKHAFPEDGPGWPAESIAPRKVLLYPVAPGIALVADEEAQGDERIAMAVQAARKILKGDT